ncbi:NAD-dependent epimerase/dehydratase [metagenome]|uniref:GDP-mannose 4,6-dehydratase n=1 Tax=metagenome TaxID=256318 RepID=A0A2P2C087_9ZZZZ
MTRSFLTGISGQDGSYLAEHLLADGAEVHALHHATEPFPPHCPPGVVLHPGDLTDAAAVRDLLLELAPDEIYNLAALSSVAQSWREPELTARLNGRAALELMESAHRVQEVHGHPVAFVQASSAEIFGHAAQSPQTESTPLRPTSPYGEAKAIAHTGVGQRRERGLHASSAILYNHESPRRPRRFVTRRITSTVAAIVRGEVAGLTLGSLDVRRDWGWAPDYVAALVLMARSDRPRDYVVATGVSHSVGDFVAAAFRSAGIDHWEPLVSLDPDLARESDPPTLTGDASLISRELGWVPVVSFEQLVQRMVAADLAQPSGSDESSSDSR